MRYSKYPTPQDIGKMRASGYDAAIIASAEALLPRTLIRDHLITRIRAAFHGVTLGDGVGLAEGQAIDDYEDADTRAAVRAGDEKDDWSKFGPQLLRQCQSSLSFFDAPGMRFHLPAFLIAALREDIDDPVFTLTYPPSLERGGIFDLMSPEQRSVIRDYLLFMTGDPDEDDADLHAALHGYWSE